MISFKEFREKNSPKNGENGNLYIITYDIKKNPKQKGRDKIRDCIDRIDSKNQKLSDSCYRVCSELKTVKEIVTELEDCFDFVKGDVLTVFELNSTILHRKY